LSFEPQRGSTKKRNNTLNQRSNKTQNSSLAGSLTLKGMLKKQNQDDMVVDSFTPLKSQKSHEEELAEIE